MILFLDLCFMPIFGSSGRNPLPSTRRKRLHSFTSHHLTRGDDEVALVPNGMRVGLCRTRLQGQGNKTFFADNYSLT